jgi:hypothetical protein
MFTDLLPQARRQTSFVIAYLITGDKANGRIQVAAAKSIVRSAALSGLNR